MGEDVEKRIEPQGFGLGEGPKNKPSRTMDTFANPQPNRPYEIAFECPEFTCVCPKTGQPDFATIRIRYVPDALCVELKSLKLYLWSFREAGAFHEAVVNTITDALLELLQPRALQVEGDFWVRGGIGTRVQVCHPPITPQSICSTLGSGQGRESGSRQGGRDAS